VPKLWSDTIETHRREVHNAVLDATAALIAQHGLLGVSMSRIAADTGIGRATLYKYFPDVESILTAWHERQITRHLEQLVEVRDGSQGAAERLHAVLVAYALILNESHSYQDSEVAASLHRAGNLHRAEHQLRLMLQQLIVDAAQAGAVRHDIPPAELASYCLHAVTAAVDLPSKAAARRLVSVTLSALQPASEAT
jgi:AcrR family transcriptional regulator